LLTTPAEDKKPAAYAHPELLVEAADLSALQTRSGVTVRVLDVRTPKKYAAGHVPGAVALDPAGWSQAFAEQQDADKWAALIAPLGVRPDETVVVYDEVLPREAARVWYILRYWGYKDVRLLNGGWRAWLDAGGKAETETAQVAPVEGLKLKATPERLTTKGQLLDALKGNPPQIVDARSEGEFCGTDDRGNKRAGAIPGARHFEWSDAVDPKTGKFKSADELAKLFAGAGVDPAKPAVTYCQSGGRAAALAFTLELMGDKDVSNYYRSWAEWGNDPDTPVVKPAPKK
jgi:thiosulfate/3-mercaptopyruvate sulfurtransferase